MLIGSTNCIGCRCRLYRLFGLLSSGSMSRTSQWSKGSCQPEGSHGRTESCWYDRCWRYCWEGCLLPLLEDQKLAILVSWMDWNPTNQVTFVVCMFLVMDLMESTTRNVVTTLVQLLFLASKSKTFRLLLREDLNCFRMKQAMLTILVAP